MDTAAGVQHYYTGDELAPDPMDAFEVPARDLTSGYRLLWGVLRFAVEDVRVGYPGARAWFVSDERGNGLTGWTFRDVCMVLDLEPAAIRAMVAEIPSARCRRPRVAGSRTEVRVAA